MSGLADDQFWGLVMLACLSPWLLPILAPLVTRWVTTRIDKRARGGAA